MSRALTCGMSMVVLFTGCAVQVQNPPSRYVEDFGGARVGFRVDAGAQSGEAWIHLAPGVCRRFMVTGSGPPQFVAQYQCPYSPAGVRVALWLEGQPRWWPAVTDANGDAHFLVRDDVAARIPAEMVARVFVGRVDVGGVSLQPLVVAALERLSVPPPPAPEAVVPPPPLPAPPPTPVPAPPANVARTRHPTDGEVFVFTSAVCLVKVGLAAKCEEKFGAAGCSAASQWLSTGRVDLGQVAKDAAIAKATEDHKGVQAFLQGLELVSCYGEVSEKIAALEIPVD